MSLPGNRTAQCAKCTNPVVISLPGRRLLADPPELPAGVLCFDCALRELGDEPFLTVPGAVELARAAGVPQEHLDRHKSLTAREFIELTRAREWPAR